MQVEVHTKFHPRQAEWGKDVYRVSGVSLNGIEGVPFHKSSRPVYRVGDLLIKLDNGHFSGRQTDHDWQYQSSSEAILYFLMDEADKKYFAPVVASKVAEMADPTDFGYIVQPVLEFDGGEYDEQDSHIIRKMAVKYGIADLEFRAGRYPFNCEKFNGSPIIYDWGAWEWDYMENTRVVGLERSSSGCSCCS